MGFTWKHTKWAAQYVLSCIQGRTCFRGTQSQNHHQLQPFRLVTAATNVDAHQYLTLGFLGVHSTIHWDALAP